MTQLVSLNGAAPVPWPIRLWVDDASRPGHRRRLMGPAITQAVIEAAGGVLVDAPPSPSARQLPAVWVDGAWSLPDKPVSTRQAEMDAALKARFQVLLAEGYEVNGVVIDLEGESFVRIREAGDAMGGGGGAIAAVTVRRQAIDLPNQAAANAVRAAARGRYLALAEAERSVFDAIWDAEADHDSLDLVDIPAGTVDGEGGWP